MCCLCSRVVIGIGILRLRWIVCYNYNIMEFEILILKRLGLDRCAAVWSLLCSFLACSFVVQMFGHLNPRSFLQWLSLYYLHTGGNFVHLKSQSLISLPRFLFSISTLTRFPIATLYQHFDSLSNSRSVAQETTFQIQRLIEFETISLLMAPALSLRLL